MKFMSISKSMNFARIFQLKNFDRDGKYEKFVTNFKQTHLKLPENPENRANLSTLKKLVSEPGKRGIPVATPIAVAAAERLQKSEEEQKNTK